MATSVRTVTADRLGKSGTLSLKKDIFGIYSNDNPQRRSLLTQMDLIKNKPFVRVALVTVEGDNIVIPTPQPQRDLDNANTIYQRKKNQGGCDAWVYCVGSRTVNRLHLTFLDQDACPLGSTQNITDDQDELFDLGRDMGANIVCYYIWSSTVNAGGCSAYPPGRRGFWIGSGPNNLPRSPKVAFAHELTHVVGNNPHVTTPSNNLMTRARGKPVSSTLTPDQCNRILTDPDMEHP